MSGNTFDFVVVGGGSNTLSAAAYLAAGGHSVVVLERRGWVGGGCITREATVPGFRHDLHATNVFLVKANPLIRCDELGLLSRFGLEYVVTDEPYHGSLFEDGSGVRVYTDLDRTCAALAELDPRDAEAYRGFASHAAKFVDLLSWGMFAPPLDSATFVEVLQQSPDGRYLLDLMQKSAWEVIAGAFRDTRIQSHLYRMTGEMMVSPEEKGTAFALFIILGFSHRYTSGFVKGGSQGFSDALVRCLEHHGGTVLTKHEVVRIETRGGRATGAVTADGGRFVARQAVVAGIAPWTLDRFVEGASVQALADARAARSSDFGVFLSSYALKEPVRPRYHDSLRRMQINQCMHTDVNRIRSAFENVRNGRVPGRPEEYFANFICASLHDPTRAPPGKATLYLYHMVPMIPEGRGPEAWNELSEGFAHWLFDGASAYLENLTADNVLGAHHESPHEMSHCLPSFRHGDVMGLGTFAEQFLSGRPTLALAQYRVPGVERLYLSGPFMHPGGGITGGGRAVAMRVLSDLDLDLDQAFPFH
ncbi:MAG TPA: NAD(P)/FAD-dependent oxidoreductase [Nevskiaceae bacterium]|nr:NAD(P)/FAD-dependent oxidoreductase [Nevskiaceae bacterium]